MNTLLIFSVVSCIIIKLIHANFLTGTAFVTVDLSLMPDSNIIIKRFWESTGLCPPDPKTKVHEFLLSSDEKLNMLLIGALPNAAIKQIRIHWLLNLLQIRFEPNGVFHYNYTFMDNLFDWMYDQALYPGFEIMGVPICDRGDGKPRNCRQILNLQTNPYSFWYKTVFEIAQRYSERYGFRYIKKWRFETWNEPDLKTYNLLNFTLKEYFLYVQASSDALQAFAKTQRSSLKLGGPAGLFKDPIKHPLCWGLLRKCDAEKKWRICPVQFISFHRKGDGVADKILNESLALLNLMHSQFPNTRQIPVANDEADILTNWSLSEEWRGDVRYAAMIVKVIIDHFKVLVVNMNITLELLSNDNAFLNYNPYYFTQRTLFARFQMNNTNPVHIQFIKKPVYAVMGLLSFIGDEFVKDDFIAADSLVSLLASRSAKNIHKSHTTSLLITFVNNTESESKSTRINTVFNSLPGLDSKYVIYVLDNLVTNPYFFWKSEGSPVFPNESVRRKMRTFEEPFRLIGPSKILNSTLRVRLDLRLPSVALIHICSVSKEPPGRVTHLSAFNITWNEVLLAWKDNKVGTKYCALQVLVTVSSQEVHSCKHRRLHWNYRCIRTYEVEFQPSCEQNECKAFRRVNSVDIIFLSYHHAVTGNSAKEGTLGKYRVRAVDYWNVPGKYSKYLIY